jgi:beta-alanine degradation protein BauB
MFLPPETWPLWRKEEFNRNKRLPVVGTRLVSETNDVRVWLIDLAPGQRLPFHLHVLNYFWTAMTVGRVRSISHDGDVFEATTKIGDTGHTTIAAGEWMIHDLENIGEKPLLYSTVELKIGSANKPLPLPALPERTS